MGCLIIGIGIFFLVFAFSISPLFGVVVIIGLIGIGVYLNKRDAEKKEEEINTRKNNLRNIERGLEDFSISQKYVSNDMNTAVMLDEIGKKVCIIYSELRNNIILDYRDILESEIIEDGSTITKTSRSSQIGGALLGGVLLGGVGAIIGGLSGEKTSVKEVIRVDLKIVVNNTKVPVHIINFLLDDSVDDLVTGKPFGIKKDTPRYKEANRNANHWHSLMSVLIRQADESDKKSQKKENNHIASTSVADELKKLSDLFKEGILTKGEYEELKETLLMRNKA